MGEHNIDKLFTNILMIRTLDNYAENEKIIANRLGYFIIL